MPLHKKQKLDVLGRLLKTAGEGCRLRILCILYRRKKMCVSDIAAMLSVSVASVSHHVRAMAKEGLLVSVKEGKRVCYLLPATAISRDLKHFICRYK